MPTVANFSSTSSFAHVGKVEQLPTTVLTNNNRMSFVCACANVSNVPVIVSTEELLEVAKIVPERKD